MLHGEALTLKRHHLTAWAGGPARSHHAPRLPDSIREITVGIVSELGEAVQGVEQYVNSILKPDPEMFGCPHVMMIDTLDVMDYRY